MKRTAIALVAFGGGLVVTGIAMFSVPLALIVAGVGLAAFGLLAVEVSR